MLEYTRMTFIDFKRCLIFANNKMKNTDYIAGIFQKHDLFNTWFDCLVLT